MKPTDFAIRLTAFLREYLPMQRNASPNTITSYGRTFALLLAYCRDQHRISPQRVDLDCLTPQIILAFLADLEERRKCCIATRNQRLAAIRSFFRYLHDLEPDRLQQCQRILAISGKRSPVSSDVNHLTPDRMKQLLAGPNLRTSGGRRDATLLSLLYDAGLRVQELIDLTPGQIRLESPAQLNVTGKGRKRRLIPLMERTGELLGAYLREQELDDPRKTKMPLFPNSQGKPLTRAGVRYIVRKYAQKMPPGTAGDREQVTPHTLRHSKAMHLLQSGNPLVVIQSFLGHSDIRTTTIYAKADLEMMRAALENTASSTPEMPSQWMRKPDLLAWLQSL